MPTPCSGDEIRHRGILEKEKGTPARIAVSLKSEAPKVENVLVIAPN